MFVWGCKFVFRGSILVHGIAVGSFNKFSRKAVVVGVATLRNNCFLGAASTVEDHVILSNYVMVGVTTFVFKTIEEYEVVVSGKSMILEDKKDTDFLINRGVMM